MNKYWRRLRHQVAKLALRYPRPFAGLVFLFVFTVSNQVEFASSVLLDVSLFWHMVLMGVLMGFFVAVAMYEVSHLQGQLAQVQFVRTVVSTLHHEINNPLTVIWGSAQLLRNSQAYDEASVDGILEQSQRIRDVMAKLGQMDEEIKLRKDVGFEGVIDLDRSH